MVMSWMEGGEELPKGHGCNRGPSPPGRSIRREIWAESHNTVTWQKGHIESKLSAWGFVLTEVFLFFFFFPLWRDELDSIFTSRFQSARCQANKLSNQVCTWFAHTSRGWMFLFFQQSWRTQESRQEAYDIRDPDSTGTFIYTWHLPSNA